MQMRQLTQIHWSGTGECAHVCAGILAWAPSELTRERATARTRRQTTPSVILRVQFGCGDGGEFHMHERDERQATRTERNSQLQCRRQAASISEQLRAHCDHSICCCRRLQFPDILDWVRSRASPPVSRSFHGPEVDCVVTRPSRLPSAL